VFCAFVSCVRSWAGGSAQPESAILAGRLPLPLPLILPLPLPLILSLPTAADPVAAHCR
jgi:hypothetical protein